MKNIIQVMVKGKPIRGQRRSIIFYTVLARNILHKTKHSSQPN